MNMTQIDCISDLVVALGQREEEVEKELRLTSALKLFEMGKISSGLAAKLASLSRVDFLLRCSQYDVSIFQQNETEIAADIENVLEVTK